MDFQMLYPKSLVPDFIQNLPTLYVGISGDFLIGGSLGLIPMEPLHLVWFKSFLYVEFFFQFPVFILGAYGLWKGSSSIYVLLLLYGASTATTTLPCLTTIIFAPITTSGASLRGIVSLTTEQRLMLLSSYVPFFLLPLLMAVDMALRVSSFVQAGIRAEESRKHR